MPAARPRMSHRAMSIAAFAAGLPTVRSSRSWTDSRSRAVSPRSCGAKIFSITATIDSWVSPYV